MHQKAQWSNNFVRAVQQSDTIRCWSPNVTRSVVIVSWFTRNYCACASILYISELCEDCAVANEIDNEIDDAWASINDNGHVITACDVWLQQRIAQIYILNSYRTYQHLLYLISHLFNHLFISLKHNENTSIIQTFLLIHHHWFPVVW